MVKRSVMVVIQTNLKSVFFAVISAVFLLSCSSANEFTTLLDQVEKLNISCDNYTLGKALTDRQKKTARQNTVQEASQGTWKFKDKDLYVVADKNSDRVIILYEQHEKASEKKTREMIGSLFLEFGDPTVMAHDKLIYWAFDAKGKVSGEKYSKIKDAKEPLQVLATVKLSSSEKIMGNPKYQNIYYIISSEPVLKYFSGL
ncbi:hypothetical protein QUF80_03525 [Desulfococcaceae bacterium HSG8]|nr:hypothetical protein [Desulfococcaceae bacterium HSG8]